MDFHCKEWIVFQIDWIVTKKKCDTDKTTKQKTYALQQSALSVHVQIMYLY